MCTRNCAGPKKNASLKEVGGFSFVELQRMQAMARLGIMLLGWTAVVLAMVGAVLPLVPTTPFALLAAACFARVSPRSYEWLLKMPILGEAIQDWQAFRSLRLSTKKRVGLMAGVTAIMSVAGGPLAILMSLLGCVFLAVILLRIPSLSEGSSC